jgi:hypothetical protein
MVSKEEAIKQAVQILYPDVPNDLFNIPSREVLFRDPYKKAFKAFMPFLPIPDRGALFGSIKNISYELAADEFTEAVFFCLPGGPYGGLWATNKRIVYLGYPQGRLGVVQWDKPARATYYYEMIYSVSVGNGILIIATTGSRDEWPEITTDKKGHFSNSNHIAQQFADIIRRNKTRANQVLMASAQSTQPASNDVTSELERLGQLWAQGTLTEAEFAAAKAKLLGL